MEDGGDGVTCTNNWMLPMPGLQKLPPRERPVPVSQHLESGTRRTRTLGKTHSGHGNTCPISGRPSSLPSPERGQGPGQRWTEKNQTDRSSLSSQCNIWAWTDTIWKQDQRVDFPVRGCDSGLGAWVVLVSVCSVKPTCVCRGTCVHGGVPRALGRERRGGEPVWLGLGWHQLPRITGPFPLVRPSGLGLWGAGGVHTAPPIHHGARGTQTCMEPKRER